MVTERFVGVDRGAFRRVVVGAGLALLSMGCAVQGDGYVPSGGSLSTGEVFRRSIDVGEGLDLDPGQGVAVVVEAHPLGEWRLAATGDALLSGFPFRWDLVVSLAGVGDLEVVEDASLEEGDYLRRVDGGALRVALVTGYGDDPPRPPRAVPGAGDAGRDAEPGDGSPAVAADAAGSLRGDLDVVVLRAPAGVPLQLDVIADGYHDASYVMWTGDGAVRAGAPSNPIVLVPVAP